MNTEQEVKQEEPVELEVKIDSTQEKQDVEIRVTGFTLFGQIQ
jgi:hypothetical protein